MGDDFIEMLGQTIWILWRYRWYLLCYLGGLPNEVLHAFSAAPTYNYSVANYRDKLDELFYKLLDADKKGEIICCGTEP